MENSPSISETQEIVKLLGSSSLSAIFAEKEMLSPVWYEEPFVGEVRVIVGAVPTVRNISE